MSNHSLDIDAEKVQFENQWYTREELARRIKGMLDAGNYAVGDPGKALEFLTSSIASVRTLPIRMMPEMADALASMAQRQGRTGGSIVREALTLFLGGKGLSAEPESGQGKAASKGKKAAGEFPPAEPSALEKTQPGLAGQVIAGPGALKNAGVDKGSAGEPSIIVDKAIVTEAASPEEAAQAVDLTKKKKDEEIEKAWFGR